MQLADLWIIQFPAVRWTIASRMLRRACPAKKFPMSSWGMHCWRARTRCSSPVRTQSELSEPGLLSETSASPELIPHVACFL